MSLEVGSRDQAWHRSGKLAEGVKDVLRLQCHTRTKILAMHLSRRAHSWRILPGSWSLRMKWAAPAELAFAKRIHGRTHIRKMGRAVGFHDILEPGRIRVWPSSICVESKTHSGNLWRSARTEDTKRINPVEHPSAKSHRLKKKRARVAARRQLGGHFGKGPLLDKSQRPSVLNIDDVLEFLDAGDGSSVDIVAHNGPVLQEVAKGKEHMLREIGDRDYQECSRTVGYPGIVRLHERRLLRKRQAAVPYLANTLAKVGQHSIKVERAVVLPLCTGRRIAIIQDVDALVVGEKCFAGMKARCGRK
jgi:hypothetical protein